MHTDLRPGVRESLWRLGAPSPTPDRLDARTPLLLRTPAITTLWMATLLTLASLLALGRVRVPHVVQGPVVAVRDERDSLALVFLVPPTERRFLTPHQTVVVDTGDTSAATLSVEPADLVVLDAGRARREFRAAGSLVAHLDTPRLAVRVSRCGPGGCLTPRVGDAFAATMRLRPRSLASYALAGS